LGCLSLIILSDHFVLSSFGVWLLEADESMPDSNESDDSKEVESECADKEKHDSSFFWGFGA